MAYLPDPVLALAAAQCGVVTVRDLLDLRDTRSPGTRITRGMIDGWLRRGYLERLCVGVYRLSGTAALPMQRHYAALRRGGSGARLGGPSVLGLVEAEAFDLAVVEPFVLIAAGRRLANVDFHWLAVDVPSGDAARFAGNVPGVTPTRALIEAAGVVEHARVRVAYDDLRRRGVVQRPRLVERAHTLLGQVPGAAAMLDILASGALDKDSEGERRLATVFLPADPWPLWQVWLLSDVRVDAFFPEARLALEYHGRKHHTIDVDRQRDLERAARLAREADVEVLVVWDEDLDDRAALRSRILGRRAERIRRGVAPLRDFRLARR